MHRRNAAGGLLLIAMGAAGCSMMPNDGTIPFGRWEGEGVYAGHDMASDEGKPTTSQPGRKVLHTGTYHTYLIIQPAKVDGRDVIELKIQSHHSGNPDFEGKSVFIGTMLEKGRRVSSGWVTYDIIKKSYDMSLTPPTTYADADPPVMASCISRGGETVLMLEYDANFVEVLRFRNGSVEKTGIFSSKESAVHWWEELKKR